MSTDQNIQPDPAEDAYRVTEAEVAELRERLEAAEQRADEASRVASEATGREPKYVIYDKTYLRYVGDPHDTRAEATKAAKAAKVKDFRVDEV